MSPADEIMSDFYCLLYNCSVFEVFRVRYINFISRKTDFLLNTTFLLIKEVQLKVIYNFSLIKLEKIKNGYNAVR